MPELPEARRSRFVAAYDLSTYHAGQITQSKAHADYFEATVAAGAAPQSANNWITGTRTLMDAPGNPPADRLAEFVKAVDAGAITGAVGKDVLGKMVATGRSAGEIIAAEGLEQVDDESVVARLVDDVIARNADAVAQYRSGKTATFGFLVGQVMKAAAGKANPKRVNELLKRALGS